MILAFALASAALFTTACAPGQQGEEQSATSGIEDELGYKAAVSAYEGVLEEYRTASEDDSSDHCYFSYVDLNEDGIPELLIGEGEDPASREGLPISKIMSYQDETIVDLGTGPTEASPRLCQDDVIYSNEGEYQLFGTTSTQD